MKNADWKTFIVYEIDAKNISTAFRSVSYDKAQDILIDGGKVGEKILRLIIDGNEKKVLEKTVQTIAESLKKIGFFKVTGRKDMEMFWRSVLSRSALSEGEAQYIEKVFTKAAGLVSKNKAPEDAE